MYSFWFILQHRYMRSTQCTLFDISTQHFLILIVYKLQIKLDVAFRTPHCGTKSKQSCYLKSEVPTQSKNVPLNPFLVFSHDLKMILSNWTMKFLQTKPLTIWQFLSLLSIIRPWWCFLLMFFKVGVSIYEGNQ